MVNKHDDATVHHLLMDDLVHGILHTLFIFILNQMKMILSWLVYLKNGKNPSQIVHFPWKMLLKTDLILKIEIKFTLVIFDFVHFFFYSRNVRSKEILFTVHWVKKRK